MAVPSKISVELPSAPWVPVSVPPEFFRVSVAWRSPIGVLMVIFQFPSTAISKVSRASFAEPEWFGNQASGGWYSPSPVEAKQEDWPSGARGANPVGHRDAKRDVLDGKRRDLGPEQHHRHVERP